MGILIKYKIDNNVSFKLVFSNVNYVNEELYRFVITLLYIFLLYKIK